MPRAFVPSLRLNDAFYREIVAPLMEPYPHAAALLGWGSDAASNELLINVKPFW